MQYRLKALALRSRDFRCQLGRLFGESMNRRAGEIGLVDTALETRERWRISCERLEILADRLLLSLFFENFLKQAQNTALLNDRLQVVVMVYQRDIGTNQRDRTVYALR